MIEIFAAHGLIDRTGMQITVRKPNEIVVAHDRVQSFEKMRATVFARDNYRCVYCGSSEQLSCDHVVPSSRGGLTILTNLVAACSPCNTKKGRLTPEEWSGTHGAAPWLHRYRPETVRSSPLP
jgi:5-methylcytosine-specific restriction endonuclease McrA